jgi:Domain of unknown function (DUF4350)
VSDARGEPRKSIFRPAITLSILAVIVIVVAVLTPEATTARSGDARLTTYSTSSQGAKGFYELAGRLGWHVERQKERGTPAFDSTTIRALLAPPLPLPPTEVHRVLEDVRRGGALLTVLSRGEPLEDSLPIHIADSGGGTYKPPSGQHCQRLSGALALWPDWQVHLFGMEWRDVDERPEGPVFVTVAASDSSEAVPAAVGFPLGRGRVVVMSDPDLLRNDVIRVCRWALDVQAVRALEYLSEGLAHTRRRVVFDEYHQGFGDHPGSISAVMHYLGATTSGRALLQIIAAVLVLTVATGVRAVPPRAPGRVERRSPLEHVDALAHAYARVGATRTVAMRLLHGMRRRVESRVRGAGRSDDALLDAAVTRQPRLREDVAIVRRALTQPVSSHELDRAAEALDNIESSLTKPIA